MNHLPTYSRYGEIMQLLRYWSIRLCGKRIDQSEYGMGSVVSPRYRPYKYAPNGNFDIINRSANLLTGRAERRLNYLLTYFYVKFNKTQSIW